jgi:hypothetical protein
MFAIITIWNVWGSVDNVDKAQKKNTQVTLELRCDHFVDIQISVWINSTERLNYEKKCTASHSVQDSCKAVNNSFTDSRAMYGRIVNNP